MFQSFEVRSNPATGAPRVTRLREELARLGLQGFLVPRADEHQNEYVPACAERLSWLTGFTGSAGAALILMDKALVFVDGRYALQVREQVDLSVFSIEHLLETPPARWLAESGPDGLVLGFDPWLHTISEARALADALATRGGRLVPVERNPIDAIWHDRPLPPRAPIAVHPLRHAGKSADSKIADLAAIVEKAGATLTVLSDPASVAWAFNIRGGDVSHTPLPLAFALLPASGKPTIFIDEAKLTPETRAYLEPLANIEPAAALASRLSAEANGNAVLLDPAIAASALARIVEEAGGTVIKAPDPARLPRAVKNPVELAGMRRAHERDGVAMATFLAWLDAQAPGSIDEIGAAVRLEETRRATGERFQMPLKEISFETISGAGPNGAIVHYRVSTASNRRIERGSLYLVDSGAQYEDGTTDITRTVAIGEPTAGMRRHFTLVLKGMIAISTARFPKGTRGADIDVLARHALWQAGCDYAHGTGHGVGAYLSVHEGPQSISKRGMQELLPGMVVSNEPGYYRPGAYGIRIENLVAVTEGDLPEGGDMPMRGFETLTLCPIDRRLIDTDLLRPDERAWLDAYHARVREVIGPHLEPPARQWLDRATEPL